jgi:YVTN family beta-propeller protein
MRLEAGTERQQAALEYLIVYGMLLLIVLIATVLLYTLFQSPQSKVPNSCTFSGGVTCTDLILSSNVIGRSSQVTVLLSNAGDEPIAAVSAKVSVKGTNSSLFSCVPHYVKPGGSILCIVNVSTRTLAGQLLSGTIYLSEQNCAFSSSSQTCQGAAKQTYSGSFVGTTQGNTTNPNIKISLASGPLLTLSYLSVSNQYRPPQYIAFSPTAPIAYVVIPGAQNVSIVNTGTSTLVGNITVGQAATSAYVNPSGTLAYVLDYATSTITIINTGNNVVVNTITVRAPTDVAFNPSGTLAYVTSYSSGNVVVISTATNAAINSITVGTEPYFVAFSPTAPLAYVVNYGASTVSAINTATNVVAPPIGVGSEPQLLAFSPDGSLVYVPNSGGSTVSAINTGTDAVTSINVGPNPYDVVFNPSGTLAYVSNGGSNTISVINTHTLAVNTITISSSTNSGPNLMVLTPSGSFLYVANLYANTISLVDTATNAVGTLPLESNPTGVFFNPQGTLAYSLKGGSNVITIVDLSKYPSANQKYGMVATMTAFGLPFRAATINFSTPDSYFQISPRYVLTNSSGQAVTYITTPLPGSNGIVYANFTNLISANTVVVYR